MLKIKKASIDSCKTWTKAKYTLWENNKICIVKYYSSCSPRYCRDIKRCFNMIWGFFMGIGFLICFPFILIYILLSFIPAIYIKDKSIDESKGASRNKVDKKIEEYFNELKEDK